MEALFNLACKSIGNLILFLGLLKEEFLIRFPPRVGFFYRCMPTSRVLFYLFGISLDDKEKISQTT